MQNMIMGMRTLNISQGYNTSYTHKNLLAWDLAGEDTGIDTFRAKNYLKVLAILPYKTTGFANTVIFGTSDQYGNPAYVHTPRIGDQILSIAMTHDNAIASYIKVGAVFGNDEMIYEEGTTGQSTGNHIHLEVGLGWQYKKVHLYGDYYDGSVYCLQNLVKPEDAIFLLNGYNRVFNNKGYNVQWCDSVDGGDKLMIAYGLNEVTWNNNKVYIYKQDPSFEDVGMISASGGDCALQTINKIDDDRVHDAKMNAGYFVMNGNGQHLGVEQTPQLNLVPRQNGKYLALWVKTDNEPGFDYSDNYWMNPPHDVKFACTPAAIMLFNGEDTDIISTGLGDKRTLLNSQSMFLRFEDGAYGFAVTTNSNWNAYNCRNFSKDYGCTMCALMDSGGSTQMIVNGKKVVYTGRAIANVLTIFRKGTDNTVWGDNDDPVETDWKAKYDEIVVELDTRTKERDEAIDKYNELAVDYDESVTDNRKLTELMSNINSHVQDISELVEEYNNDEQ